MKIKKVLLWNGFALSVVAFNLVLLYSLDHVGLAVVFLACAPMVILALFAKRRRLQTYERLMRNIPATDETDASIPVRFASAKRFDKLCKFFAWERCGILRIGHDNVTFHTGFSSGTDLSLAFDPSTSQVAWLGRYNVLSGDPLSWVIISKAGKRHYFTSETGISILGSKRTTKVLYEKLNECLRRNQLTSASSGLHR
jgi:hypothetical protein